MQFEVRRDDLRQHRFETTQAGELDDGEVLLRIASFALTANNITYAAFGDVMSYWSFFPAAEGWGRIPVWGFADVEASRADSLPEGERVFGYLPMGSHLVVTPEQVRSRGFVDGVAHRSALPAVYNHYERVGSDPSHDVARESHQSLLRPLFMTSFLIDDWLADNGRFDAGRVVLSSASSKTSLGLAYLLARREGCEVVGLTSPGNVAFVAGVGYYDRVVPYGSLHAEVSEGVTVFVDMAGDGTVRAEVHDHYPALARSVAVGATHWEQLSGGRDLHGPRPTVFFAPDHVQKRRADWGPGGLEERFGGTWSAFLASVDGWLTVVEGQGQDAVVDAYESVLEGRIGPDEGRILSL